VHGSVFSLLAGVLIELILYKKTIASYLRWFCVEVLL
jgi:hypothetical protein